MKKNFFALSALTVLIVLVACQNDKTKPNETLTPSSIDSTLEHSSPHHIHEKTFGHLNYTMEKQWDSLSGITHKAMPLNKSEVKRKYRVFGWHIYSNGTAYKNYNFDLLWGLSYFAYIVDPKTGGYKKIHQWKTTPLIDSAQVNDCKVFLTIANFGKKANAQLLGNPKAQKTLADSVISLLSLRGADGVNIDFEGVAKENSKQLTDFIVSFSKELKTANPEYMLSLCLYAIDYHKVFDIKAIDTSIDFYTLMGYDYYGSFSHNAGPVTPLKTSKSFGKGLEYSVNNYIKRGVKPEKLIAGLPYYGAEWVTKSKVTPSKAKKFLAHPIYKTIRSFNIGTSERPVSFEEKTASTYCVITKENGSVRQLWFEDSTSLSIKYDWLKKQKIGGVGIWALGYDNGYTELWDLLAEKFGEKK